MKKAFWAATAVGAAGLVLGAPGPADAAGVYALSGMGSNPSGATTNTYTVSALAPAGSCTLTITHDVGAVTGSVSGTCDSSVCVGTWGPAGVVRGACGVKWLTGDVMVSSRPSGPGVLYTAAGAVTVA